MTRVALIALRGAGGEPVDLRRTLGSHGVAELPPMAIDDDGRGAAITLATPDGPRTVRLAEAPRPRGGGVPAVAVDVADAGPPPAQPAAAALAATVRRMLCLDDDLSGFYAKVAGDPDLAWAARGAGRLLRSPTVFEDVVKTVCTTNCAWSATERMVGALVGRLGEPAPGAPPARRRRSRLPDAGGHGRRGRGVLRRASPAPGTAARISGRSPGASPRASWTSRSCSTAGRERAAR